MFRLKFQSDWTQAERSIHMARSSRANNSEFSSWFVQTRKSGPIDLFSTYFKYLVSQFKAFSCRSGVHFYTSMIKRNNGFMWPGALTFRTAPHRFLSVEDWMFCSETVPPCGRGGQNFMTFDFKGQNHDVIGGHLSSNCVIWSNLLAFRFLNNISPWSYGIKSREGRINNIKSSLSVLVELGV